MCVWCVCNWLLIDLPNGRMMVPIQITIHRCHYRIRPWHMRMRAFWGVRLSPNEVVAQTLSHSVFSFSYLGQLDPFCCRNIFSHGMHSNSRMDGQVKVSHILQYVTHYPEPNRRGLASQNYNYNKKKNKTENTKTRKPFAFTVANIYYVLCVIFGECINES